MVGLLKPTREESEICSVGNQLSTSPAPIRPHRLVFVKTKLATDAERAEMSRILRMAGTSAEVSEVELILYLQAALTISDRHEALKFAIALHERGRNTGCWIDLTTTATVTSLLIDALTMVRGAGADPSVSRSIEDSIFNGIHFIQAAYEEANSAKRKNRRYPWGGKAYTTVRCINAWLKFDHLIDFPVYECIKALEGYDRETDRQTADCLALGFLEKLKNENDSLLTKIENLKFKIIAMRKKNRTLDNS